MNHEDEISCQALASSLVLLRVPSRHGGTLLCGHSIPVVFLEDVETTRPRFHPCGVRHAARHEVRVSTTADIHLTANGDAHRSAQNDPPLVTMDVFGDNNLPIRRLVEHDEATITRRQVGVEGDVCIRPRQVLDELRELVLRCHPGDYAYWDTASGRPLSEESTSDSRMATLPSLSALLNR